MAPLFVFFFVSGFCSLLCELIWMRLAMAQFGVTTALTSIVLSVFMAGLGAGSWFSGTLLHRYGDKIRFPALRIYASLELMIGLSALVVPVELAWGHQLLAALADHAAVSSGLYYIIAGLCLSLTMVPFCACMGATIPVAMFTIGKRKPEKGDSRSFSFLYLANALGSVLGSFLPLLIIEELGFHQTLRVGAALNVAIAAGALLLSTRMQPSDAMAANPPAPSYGPEDSSKSLPVLLFATGLATMATELLWIRLFTPYIGPVVYLFGIIMVGYLSAMYIGSQVYRFWSRRHKHEYRLLWISLAVAGILPLYTSDTTIDMNLFVRVFLGVMPFAGLTGFLTPMLVDRWSGGNPVRAGHAYAVNVVGCILGPLFCGFVLLPRVGEHWALLLLSLPWFVMALPSKSAPEYRKWSQAVAVLLLVCTVGIFSRSHDFETRFPVRRVLRDSTATSIAEGVGMKRRLLVNGTGMTYLTPITKLMAHLPLASLNHTPRSALIICFGIGTTFRSAASWGISTTAVELVPSVPKLFSFFYSDADQVMASPLVHVVADDGRRYLERNPAKYDVIILDPPPPVQTAGSSLLYSQDFYTVAKKRLEPGGILQQWLPDGDAATQAAVARALKNSFAYLKVYRGIEGWGWHFLASDQPIPDRTVAALVARMPAAAVKDMTEWGPAATPELEMSMVLDHTTTVDNNIALSPATPALSDDRPINEFFVVRTPFDDIMDMESPDF
jgi:predicted membrane-bound spermidine synthase